MVIDAIPQVRTAKLVATVIGYLLATIVALSLALTSFGLYRKWSNAAVEQNTSSAAAVSQKAKAQGTAIYIKEKEEVRVRTEEVLEANVEFSDGHVPADVADLLRDNPRPRR